MLPLLFNALLLVSAIVGLPALLVVLWHLAKRASASEAAPLVLKLSQGTLLVFGALFVLSGITIPILFSRLLPLRDEQLVTVAPQFAQFKLAYTSTFAAKGEMKLSTEGGQLCLSFHSLFDYRPDDAADLGASYGGWMIVLWNGFFAKTLGNLGYPSDGRDLSRYSALVIRLRTESGNGVLELAVKDRRGREARLPLADITPHLQTVEIPFAKLTREGSPPDLSSIETISFAVNAAQVAEAQKDRLAPGDPIAQTICIQKISLK